MSDGPICRTSSAGVAETTSFSSDNLPYLPHFKCRYSRNHELTWITEVAFLRKVRTRNCIFLRIGTRGGRTLQKTGEEGSNSNCGCAALRHEWREKLKLPVSLNCAVRRAACGQLQWPCRARIALEYPRCAISKCLYPVHCNMAPPNNTPC